MAESPEDRDDATVAAICASVLGLALTFGALGFYGKRTALSVALGAAIAVANLLMMRAIVRSVIRPPDEDIQAAESAGPSLGEEREGDASASKNEDEGEDEDADETASSDTQSPESKRGGALWGIFAVVKIFVLFGGLWLLLTKRMVDPIPLVVGYGVLPLGIAATTLVNGVVPARKPRKRRR